MKKSILLGSAAALVAVTGAQAADLPVVEPVDYVKVCDAFGAGFHYIPGTETCLKFSGRVRTEIGVQDDQDNDATDSTFLNSNFELVVNASSMTEVGMVVGQFAISGSNEGAVELGDAWITIGENILVGRETSRFDFGGGYGMYDGAYVDEGINQFTFIMPFGNGVSFTLGLENGKDRRVGNTYAAASGAVWIDPAASVPASSADTYALAANDLVTPFAAGSDGYGGMQIPEIVASLRISQGWGSAQVSGALHEIRNLNNGTGSGTLAAPVYNGASAVTPAIATGANITQTINGAGIETDTEFGFAIQAGVELNVGSMTKVKVVGGYADGALHYVGGAAVNGLVGAGTVNDYSVNATGGIVTNDAWYALAGLEHAFGGGLTASVNGAYHEFDMVGDYWYASANLAYEVVENLTATVGGSYQEFDPDAAGPDVDSWQAKLRIQRDF